MFIRETFAAEYIERYVEENINLFREKKKIVILTVCEQGINFFELLRNRNISVEAFADDNEVVKGKVIYRLPVLNINEIPEDAFIIVSSPTIAYRDRNRLVKMGYREENIFTMYPNVIQYFSEHFINIDKEQYKGITKKENTELYKKELRNKVEVKSIPTMLIVDLTTKCNLVCRHCDMHHNKEISKLRNMEEDYTPVERYKFLLDYADNVYLNISGEPLLSPKFWEILDYIDQSDNDPYLFSVTNGILLDEKAANRIVDSKFKVLLVSMDAASNETYKRVRGGDFSLWCKNVRYIAQRKKEMNNTQLKIVLQHTVSREALEETSDTIKLAEELGVDEIIIRPLYENIAGKETWRVPMDEEREYYYPQQTMMYYPHITKRVMDEAKELSKHTKVIVRISERFEANYHLNIEDIPYPLPIEEFQKRRLAVETVINENNSVEEKDIPQVAKDDTLCDGPWSLGMVYTNGNIMYCNRNTQAEGNINFSSWYELRNSKMVKDMREGLINDYLSWHCLYCSGCARSDYEKNLKRAPKIIQRGDVLDFNLENTSMLRNISYEGISRIQRFGAWNNLRKSSISMLLDQDGQDYNIDLEAEAFVIPGLVNQQRVKVSANGEYICDLQYDNDEVCIRRIPIKKELIRSNGELRVEFEYLDAASPLELNFVRDDRERAIFIRKINIR